jgi:hypothetical protein
MAFKERQRMLAEIARGAEAEATEPPKSIGPGPRSERARHSAAV